MPEGTDVFEIIHSTRAMRRLKPDPVPDELIRNILLAGQAAASGGNTQRWRFLVLTDPEIKKKVQVYYKKAFDEVVGPRYDTSPTPPGQSADSYRRTRAANQYLTDHYHEAPVWIVACLEGASPTRSAGSSIYPAVQNMLLAARALGLGATLTTRHLTYEKETEAAMGIPRLPLLRHPAHRLPHGAVRTGRSGAACRSRLSRRMGQALSWHISEASFCPAEAAARKRQKARESTR
jgi:nitroreductase